MVGALSNYGRTGLRLRATLVHTNAACRYSVWTALWLAPKRRARSCQVAQDVQGRHRVAALHRLSDWFCSVFSDAGPTKNRGWESEPAQPASMSAEDLQRLLPLELLPGNPPWRWQWPPMVQYALQALADGPDRSQVASGEMLGEAILDMRRELKLGRCNAKLVDGLHHYFSQVLPPASSSAFFLSTLPAIARLALSLPGALTRQHEGALQAAPTAQHLPLSILRSQQPGLILLSQELIASLLSVSFLCLFPGGLRSQEMLPDINFDRLYGLLLLRGSGGEAKVHAKLHCLINYFTRVSQQMPSGTVSFERKVLPLPGQSMPTQDDWGGSRHPLCSLKVLEAGTIEDDGAAYLQVDFANAYLGGGVLGAGCVQEEIRFMICPEFLAGLFFLPAMDDNEAIEIIGAERYSTYTGYAESFQFAGNFVDTTPRDSLGRRSTHLVAIDALINPGKRQWGTSYRLREANKAYCGFLDHAPQRSWLHERGTAGSDSAGDRNDQRGEASERSTSGAEHRSEGSSRESGGSVPLEEGSKGMGVATGNWGCGAFGGDVQLKALLQWMAAAQAGRPEVLYCTFGDAKAARLKEVGAWLLREGWTVGELWGVLEDYAQRRREPDCHADLFQWLLPLRAEIGEDEP